LSTFDKSRKDKTKTIDLFIRIHFFNLPDVEDVVVLEIVAFESIFMRKKRKRNRLGINLKAKVNFKQRH